MKTIFFVLSFIVTSCVHSLPKIIKYDFVHDTYSKNVKSFSSVVLKITQDSIIKCCYFNLDSAFSIKELKRYNTYSKESYTNNNYFIDGVIKLKFDAQKGEKWKTQYEVGYYDSLSVELIDILIDTAIFNIKIDKCYIYELIYNRLSAGEDYLDYRVYFDPKRKITIRKEYYSNDKLKGTETLVSESTINAQVFNDIDIKK